MSVARISGKKPVREAWGNYSARVLRRGQACSRTKAEVGEGYNRKTTGNSVFQLDSEVCAQRTDPKSVGTKV